MNVNASLYEKNRTRRILIKSEDIFSDTKKTTTKNREKYKR